MVFEDPSISASDIEIYPGRTEVLAIQGTGFRAPSMRYTSGHFSSWSNVTRPPVLCFDPPIDLELVKVWVNVSSCDCCKPFGASVS